MDIHLKIELWSVNRIVEVFIPEVNCWEFSKVVLCSSWPWYFICKVNCTNRVLHLKNTLWKLSQRLGISCNACFYLQYLSRCLNYGALLGLPSCKSDSWRRYTCANVLLVCEREVGELVQPAGMRFALWD